MQVQGFGRPGPANSAMAHCRLRGTWRLCCALDRMGDIVPDPALKDATMKLTTLATLVLGAFTVVGCNGPGLGAEPGATVARAVDASTLATDQDCRRRRPREATLYASSGKGRRSGGYSYRAS